MFDSNYSYSIRYKCLKCVVCITGVQSTKEGLRGFSEVRRNLG